ncbi:LamG domain-containing protein [Streptomyces cadmiisoli]|uniref:LamG domain-containing protein n=1 Tax=Streptomyces cadmiisoli TaxID=2184053 RepID=UPI003D73CCDD
MPRYVPRNGERERTGWWDGTAPPPEPAATVSGFCDLTLARTAAGSGPEADAAGRELTGRHLDAALAYAARCTATPQGAALLASTANRTAVRDFLGNGSETAWRPHVLAAVLRTAAEWSRDNRQERLSAELLEWLTGPDATLGQEDEQSLLLMAFHQLPVRLRVGLWHTAVEQDGPETVARHLGAEPIVVQGWTPAVEEKFRNTFIAVLDEYAAPACRPFTRILVTASEANHRRAAVTSVSSGLDEHLAECFDCSDALRDLSQLRERNFGPLVAETLIPWGGFRYFSDRSAQASRARTLRQPAPGPVPEPGHGTRPSRGVLLTGRLRTVRNNPVALGALSAGAALIVLGAWLAVPGTEETGEQVAARPQFSDRRYSGTDGPAASTPGPSPETKRDKTPIRKDPPREKPPGPKPSPRPSQSPPPVRTLAVPGADLRWDFDDGRGRVGGTPGGRFVGDARSSGQREGSMEFGGTGYVQSDGPVIDTARNFTVSAWVRLTSKSTFQTVAGQDGTNVSGFFLQYSADDDRWRLAMGHADSVDEDECDALSLAPPAVGRWQLLTAVFDADDDELLLYVDGSLQEMDEHSPAWSAGGPFSVGRGKWEGAPSDRFRGGIDDVRVYDRALAAWEVAALAKARPNA